MGPVTRILHWAILGSDVRGALDGRSPYDTGVCAQAGSRIGRYRLPVSEEEHDRAP